MTIASFIDHLMSCIVETEDGSAFCRPDAERIIQEHDRQKFEAGRAEGWGARGEADKDLLREEAYGSMWEYYSPVVVGALKNMPLPAAQPEQRPRIVGIQYGPGRAVILVVVENREACKEIDISGMSENAVEESLELYTAKAIKAIMQFRCDLLRQDKP